MNRIVLIGNGFDLAHGLPTSYKDFIDWYIRKVYDILKSRCNSEPYDDGLCTIQLKNNCNWNEYLCSEEDEKEFCRLFYGNRENHSDKIKINPRQLLRLICNSYEDKKWVDIENIYYTLLKNPHQKIELIKSLNNQLESLKNELINYLHNIELRSDIKSQYISDKIYEPINPRDIVISDINYINEHFNYWLEQDTSIILTKLALYDKSDHKTMIDINNFKKKYKSIPKEVSQSNYVYKELLLLPDDILLLNFNYTRTAEYYKRNFKTNYIHGTLTNRQSIIFGYGDEVDRDYQTLRDLNNNEYLKNIKSIKYLETENYRNLLSFIESAPYQIYIMGHSCGNSDRTLLKTLFEHQNCVSIKPFYYIEDNLSNNYLDLIQNISRNFTDMKLMRNKVVNKLYCEPLFNK